WGCLGDRPRPLARVSQVARLAPRLAHGFGDRARESRRRKRHRPFGHEPGQDLDSVEAGFHSRIALLQLASLLRVDVEDREAAEVRAWISEGERPRREQMARLVEIR